MAFLKILETFFFCIFIVLKFGMNTFTNVLEHIPERHKLILLHFSKLGQNNKNVSVHEIASTESSKSQFPVFKNNLIYFIILKLLHS